MSALPLPNRQLITLSAFEVERYYADRLPRISKVGAEWRTACPLHGGERDSFAVDADTGMWFCHSECNRGGDAFDLEMAISGTGFQVAKKEVFGIIGRIETQPAPKPIIVATYDYRDEKNKLLYQVVRCEPKSFRQRKPDGKGGWDWSVKGVRQVLYRLPELQKHSMETVFIAEGEKDIHSLERLGLLATTCSGGSGKWRDQHT